MSFNFHLFRVKEINGRFVSVAILVIFVSFFVMFEKSMVVIFLSLFILCEINIVRFYFFEKIFIIKFLRKFSMQFSEKNFANLA